jgi:hypothetical protein
MSTRGIIAKATPTGWRGRYHHSDSYPSGLGKTLWNLAHGHFKDNLAKMMKVLVNDHTGWSCIVDKDFQWAPAYISYDSLAGEAAEAFNANVPQCFCHGERNEKGWLVTDKRGGTQQWGYVIDVKRRTMRVMHGGDGWTDVGTYSFDEGEPDWALVECGQNRERCSHYDWVHDKTICQHCDGKKHDARSGHSGGYRNSYPGEDHSRCVPFDKLPEPLKSYVRADSRQAERKDWHYYDPKICEYCGGTGKHDEAKAKAAHAKLMAELSKAQAEAEAAVAAEKESA